MIDQEGNFDNDEDDHHPVIKWLMIAKAVFKMICKVVPDFGMTFWEVFS